MKSGLAPVIVFAFNRYDELVNTIGHLLLNKEASSSDLFVFVDGARAHKTGEAEKVQRVRDFVKTITGFLSVTYSFSETNKGLGPSIIEGVTKVIDLYGKAIVLEDDLVVAEGFLSYMNTMLDAYEKDKRIMQISGFSTDVVLPKGYKYDVYLNKRGESWSWATWRDRWESVDWDISEYNSFKKDLLSRIRFNYIGSDLFGMLQKCAEQNAKIWAVRFCYSMFRQNCYQVSPVKSLVRNDGFSADSTNCNSFNRYHYKFDSRKLFFVAPENIPYIRSIDRSANRYWSIRYRIWGKIMSAIVKARVSK